MVVALVVGVFAYLVTLEETEKYSLSKAYDPSKAFGP